ncbi:hypothetical protein HDU91_005434 [Kappamyces sp. JEL0680]|nr:hypothetical protein HDU91_005434 [Kappamyces sp. JEL0680]
MNRIPFDMIFENLKLFVDNFTAKNTSKLQYKTAVKRFLDEGGCIVDTVHDANLILTSRPHSPVWWQQGVTVPTVDVGFIIAALESGQVSLPTARLDGPSTPQKKRSASELSSSARSDRATKQSAVCLESSPLPALVDSQGHNQTILLELDKLYKRYQAEGDRWRTLSYRKAIRAIQTYPSEIASGAEAGRIPNVGSKIADKIEEIIHTGHLRVNDEFVLTDDYASQNVKLLFQKVHGVGAALANQFYDQGCRTLDDLRKRPDLTETQKIGLRYFDDLQKRIPRAAVEELGKVVEAVCHEIDSNCVVEIMGSFRRGAPDCGDVDFLFYPGKEGHALSDTFLREVVDRLEKRRFIVANLKLTQSVYHGICSLADGCKRRVDFLMASYKERGAALMHFTGNDFFNRSIRNLAHKKGYILSNHGLFKLTHGSDGHEKIWVAGETEESIFETLNVPYRPPTERNA